MMSNTVQVNLNKDVLCIIGEYARPRLWLYWVRNDTVYEDSFRFSEVIEAKNRDEALVIIFDTHIRHLFKEKYQAIYPEMLKLLRTIDNAHADFNCQRCGYFYMNPDSTLGPCYEHYPSKEALLTFFDILEFGNNDKAQSIKNLIGHQIIKFKKLEW